jgi:DNA-binding LacI/PurR family transcriptional regulator
LPTIKDVARAAGVSVATVSYVINDGPRSVTEETRARVLESMRQLGYEPNISARRLRLNRTNVLGLAVAGLSGLPSLADLYFLDIIRGISITADQYDYHLMLFTNTRKLQTPEFYHKLIRQRLIDGLIVLGSTFSVGIVAELMRMNYPVIAVGRHRAGPGLRRVTFAYEQDAFRATSSLIEAGHQRIGLMLNILAFNSESARLQGYRRALQKYNIPYDPELVRVATSIELYPPRQDVAALLERANPSVIITTNYLEVCGFIEELTADRAGKTVGVLTLDVEPLLDRPPYLIGGMVLPKYEAGVAAINLLLQCIGAGDLSSIPEEIVMPESRLVMYHKT